MNTKLKSIELFLAMGLATIISIGSNSIINAEEIDRFPTDSSLLAQYSSESNELSPGEQANADFEDKLTGRKLLKSLTKRWSRNLF